MKQDKPKLLPLYLILLGSLILAVPGVVVGFILFFLAFDELSRKEPIILVLFFPTPIIIGFLLLFGYIWTARRKKLVKWFWWISAIFNLLFTLLSGVLLLILAYQNFNLSTCRNILLLLYFLFPIWTFYVTISSVKYATYNPKRETLNLP